MIAVGQGRKEGDAGGGGGGENKLGEGKRETHSIILSKEKKSGPLQHQGSHLPYSHYPYHGYN